MARLAIAHVLALNLGPVPCLQPPATTCNLVPVPPGLLTVLVHSLSVQTRLTLALLKDRPCRSSPVPPRSSPTSFTVENSSGLPFFPLLAEPPPPSLPLSLRSAISFSSFTPPLRRLSCRSRRRHLEPHILVWSECQRRRSVDSRRTTTGNSQRTQEGTYPTPSCPVWYRPVLSVTRAWPGPSV